MSRHIILFRFLFLFPVLITSGRRQKDLERIDFQKCYVDKDLLHVLVSRDKASSFQVSLVFPLRCYSTSISSFLKKEVHSLVKKTSFYFREKCWRKTIEQTLKRLQHNYTPHSLRSRRAILLAAEGYTDSDIMSILGWSSLNSLKRYTIVSTSTIRKNKLSYDQVREFKNTL